MAQFPLLETGAVMQYPGGRESQFSTAVVQFVAGDEQRFRLSRAGRKRWAVRLEMLTDDELLVLEAFFVEQQGRQGSFEFTDPWDGTTYGDCSFDADQAEFTLRDIQRGSTSLWIRQNGN